MQADPHVLDSHVQELLRAIVREDGARDRDTISSRVAAISDWDALIGAALEHRLAPLLFLRLSEAGVPVPPEAKLRLERESARNVFHSLANATELAMILRGFDEQNIPAMPFKGIVLAATVYGNLSMRSAGDLDLLIFERDLQRATSSLRARGYELKTETLDDGSPAKLDYFEFHFERSSDGMVVELRWRLELQPRFARDLGMEWVWPRRSTARVAGAEVPNLDPIANLLMLCMHGSKHFWSRMIWVCDVARLLHTHPELDWDEALREAKRCGLWRATALGILLASRICGARVPDLVLQRLASDRAARELAAYFEQSILDAPGKAPAGSIPYSLRILDGPDRARWVLRGEFLRPNERDLAAVRLPAALRPLYFFVRPLRVLFDRSAR
jgi:hypothetical protein